MCLIADNYIIIYRYATVIRKQHIYTGFNLALSTLENGAQIATGPFLFTNKIQLH